MYGWELGVGKLLLFTMSRNRASTHGWIRSAPYRNLFIFATVKGVDKACPGSTRNHQAHLEARIRMYRLKDLRPGQVNSCRIEFSDNFLVQVAQHGHMRLDCRVCVRRFENFIEGTQIMSALLFML